MSRISTAARPTHHLTLSDGLTTLGLTLCDPRGNPDPRGINESPMPKTSLQTTQGDPDYGSFVLPYVNVVQKDWSGGRAWEDFNKDGTKYYDSRSLDTIHGDVTLGPKKTITNGFAGQTLETSTPNDDAINYQFASKFVATFATIDQVEFLSTTPAWIARAYIYADNAGMPGALLAMGSTHLREQVGNVFRISVPVIANLVIGITYWVGLDYYVDGTIRYNNNAPGKVMAYGYPGAWFTIPNAEIYFKLREAGPGKFFFFEYKAALYAVTSYNTGNAPRLFRNGFAGTANSNAGALDKLKVPINFPANELAGLLVRIYSGPGFTEETNWREIISNTANEATVTPAWNITHTTATEYAILGDDTWTEIKGHGLTATVTDVLVMDDFVYFAMGDLVNIRRGRFTGGAPTANDGCGTWTWADDGTNKATFLEMIQNTEGKRKIWGANPGAGTVYAADVVAWGTNLTFGTAIPCGNAKTRITNMVPYGQPQIPYIMKEDSFGSVSNNIYAQIPIVEMASVKDDRNGRVATQFGVYLFFSLLDGFERYYENRLDDMGPNTDAGLPAIRQGPVSSAIPYPGGILVSVDGQKIDGQSSILFWNQIGWHEIFRGEAGKRIKQIYVQVMPGDYVDRLWVSEGDQITFLPIALQPRKQTGYQFTSSGDLITSWFKTGFAEINKFWRSLTLFTEGLSANQKIDAYYQTDNADDDDAWTLIGSFTASPSQELPISAAYNVTGKRIRFKLTLSTTDASKTPRLIAYNISAVVRIPPAQAWSASVLAASYMQNQQGRWEAISEQQLLAQLKTWANSKTQAAPITLRSQDPAFDNKMVFLDPASIRPVSITTEAGGGKRTVKTLNFSMVAVEEV